MTPQEAELLMELRRLFYDEPELAAVLFTCYRLWKRGQIVLSADGTAFEVQARR
jgi:hypothetical protein